LLAEAGLILEPGFDPLARMQLGDLLDLLQSLFLRASWAAGSAFGWRGRGISQL
jgi:hypothetical protein